MVPSSSYTVDPKRIPDEKGNGRKGSRNHGSKIRQLLLGQKPHQAKIRLLEVTQVNQPFRKNRQSRNCPTCHEGKCQKVQSQITQTASLRFRKRLSHQVFHEQHFDEQLHGNVLFGCQ